MPEIPVSHKASTSWKELFGLDCGVKCIRKLECRAEGPGALSIKVIMELRGEEK